LSLGRDVTEPEPSKTPHYHPRDFDLAPDPKTNERTQAIWGNTRAVSENTRATRVLIEHVNTMASAVGENTRELRSKIPVEEHSS